MSPSIAELADASADLKKSKHKKPVKQAINLDRLPPNDEAAEQGSIGCVLLSPMEILPQAIERFSNCGGPEAFYDLRHQVIFNELLLMFTENIGIDIITLQSRLKDKQMLEQVGGIPYLSALQDSAVSSANFKFYADIVVEKCIMRLAIHTCTDVVGRIYDYEGELPELLDKIEKDVLSLGQMMDTGSSNDIKASVHRSISAIEDKFNNPGVLGGLPTGFGDLDKMTDGLHGGEMIVIAARPSLGKTSLAMQIAEHVSVTNGLPVGVFSLEMSMDSLVTRMMCSKAKVNVRAVGDGFLVPTDFPKLTSAAAAISNAPLYIDDTAGLSILQLRARARRMWQQYDIKLFIIDYLQLMHSDTRRAQDNRVQEVSEISCGVKALAKELNVPVIVLSQLNRQLEQTNRKPRLSDLRESGAIEQDADVVGLLYKPNEAEEPSTEAQAKAQQINLLIAKQRNGPVGDIHFTFLKDYTRFEQAAKITDDDVPAEAAQGEWNQFKDN